LLQVPIGTPIYLAKGTFEFLEGHNNNNYGLNLSARYLDSAIDYCEGSQLENADLEVIIHNNKVASITLVSTDSDFKDEIYEFAKSNVGDPGPEVKGENWTGFKDLSVGSLLIYYSRIKERGEIAEILKITNREMLDFTIDEQVIDVTG
jgi:hypothetical protein